MNYQCLRSSYKAMWTRSSTDNSFYKSTVRFINSHIPTENALIQIVILIGQTVNAKKK